MRKKGLSLEEHKTLGSELKKAYLSICEALTLLSNRYGRTTKVGKLAEKAYDAMNLLRNELDNICCDENFPDYPNTVSPDKETEILSCYYPAVKES